MIYSRFHLLTQYCPLPAYRGTRVLLMPMIHGDKASLPEDLQQWWPTLDVCAKHTPQHKGKVVYLTVDEKQVPAGKTHRRPRLHVDGYWKTEAGHGGVWGGGGGGGAWGGGRGTASWQGGTGLLTVANHPGCRAWAQDFEGRPEVEGDCEHFRDQCDEGQVLKPGTLYWMNPACVHESLPMTKGVKRQFLRISLPSNADWYEGCTPNPKGIQPTGKIQPRRRFLKSEPVLLGV